MIFFLGLFYQGNAPPIAEPNELLYNCNYFYIVKEKWKAKNI